MKAEDIAAIKNFDSRSNIFLRVSGKGPDQHLTAHRPRIFKRFPFLGRFFKWLGFYSQDLRKVITYLLSEKGGLKDLESPELKKKIQEKIIGYFGLKDEKATKHSSLWPKIEAKYQYCFFTSEIEKKNATLEKDIIALQQQLVKKDDAFQEETTKFKSIEKNLHKEKEAKEKEYLKLLTDLDEKKIELKKKESELNQTINQLADSEQTKSKLVDDILQANAKENAELVETHKTELENLNKKNKQMMTKVIEARNEVEVGKDAIDRLKKEIRFFKQNQKDDQVKSALGGVKNALLKVVADQEQSLQLILHPGGWLSLRFPTKDDKFETFVKTLKGSEWREIALSFDQAKILYTAECLIPRESLKSFCEALYLEEEIYSALIPPTLKNEPLLDKDGQIDLFGTLSNILISFLPPEKDLPPIPVEVDDFKSLVIQIPAVLEYKWVSVGGEKTPFVTYLSNLFGIEATDERNYSEIVIPAKKVENFLARDLGLYKLPPKYANQEKQTYYNEFLFQVSKKEEFSPHASVNEKTLPLKNPDLKFPEKVLYLSKEDVLEKYKEILGEKTYNKHKATFEKVCEWPFEVAESFRIAAQCLSLMAGKYKEGGNEERALIQKAFQRISAFLTGSIKSQAKKCHLEYSYLINPNDPTLQRYISDNTSHRWGTDLNGSLTPIPQESEPLSREDFLKTYEEIIPNIKDLEKIFTPTHQQRMADSLILIAATSDDETIPLYRKKEALIAIAVGVAAERGGSSLVCESGQLAKIQTECLALTQGVRQESAKYILLQEIKEFKKHILSSVFHVPDEIPMLEGRVATVEAIRARDEKIKARNAEIRARDMGYYSHSCHVHYVSAAKVQWAEAFGLDELDGKADPGWEHYTSYVTDFRKREFLEFYKKPGNLLSFIYPNLSGKTDDRGALLHSAIYRDTLNKILLEKGFIGEAKEKELARLLPTDDKGRISLSEEAVKLMLIDIEILNP